jgi:hypothetical protein
VKLGLKFFGMFMQSHEKYIGIICYQKNSKYKDCVVRIVPDKHRQFVEGGGFIFNLENRSYHMNKGVLAKALFDKNQQNHQGRGGDTPQGVP